jgi:lipopolysaccharide transport system ATP-binding protein
MSNIAIHTENLGKRYQLGATVDFSRTFREALIGLPKYFYRLTKSKAQRLLDKTEYPKDTPKGTFWALRDINLDIQHGDVVGIIGRNGAGKSTLLKILSKITSPTTGIARINGRVGSLLEVGTGFHPELTGRENIYLNGSILGMRKAEIEKKFDEIVAFAEVEQFLDTPIKRYSSGMQVRLAFAVAAHLEPEILIVDEVLAVGDAAFQKKCLGKMEDVSKEGRTVLFVSHNMGAVRQLCNKGILLDFGNISNIGETVDVIRDYLNTSSELSQIPLINRKDKIGNGLIQIVDVIFKDEFGNIISSFSSNQNAFIFMKYTSKEKNITNINVALGFNDVNGVKLFHVNNELTGNQIKINENEGFFVCNIPNLPLIGGKYSTTIFISINREISYWVQDAFILDVVDGDFFDTGKVQSREQGILLVKHNWFVQE